MNYRSTPQIVAFTRASIAHNQTGFPKELVSARPNGDAAAGRRHPGRLRGSGVHLPADPRGTRQGAGARARSPSSTATITTASCSRASCSRAGSPTRSGAGFASSSRPTSRTCWPTCGSSSTRATKPRGDGCSCSCRESGRPRPPRSIEHLARQRESPGGPRIGRGDGPLAGQEQGLLRRVRRATSGSSGPPIPRRNPAAAIGAILKGGYPDTVRLKYERPDNRIADIEQFALLAAKYDSLERLIADLILAGDVYGMDSLAADEPREVVVLSTVHQAKGLEWSHVFVLRLIEESFPHRRSLDEPGGEEEERRIFYVAITRAMNELTLTYPLCIPRGGRGPTVFTTPSRFLAEIDESLLERAEIESDSDARGAIPGRASRAVGAGDEGRSRTRDGTTRTKGAASCRSVVPLASAAGIIAIVTWSGLGQAAPPDDSRAGSGASAAAHASQGLPHPGRGQGDRPGRARWSS